MYYSNGNYEAFAHPRKPEGVDNKSAYLVGAGLASLAAACFLVRDGQMKGENIHILEEQKLAGGACDGIKDASKGFIIRGGREMENHFECLWDLFRSIPSLETEEASVLDEYYWLNKKDPNYSLMRATINRGEDAHTDGKFGLSEKASMEIIKLFMTKDEDLYDKKITDVFTDEFFESNFWLYWRTMFAFEDWHSALEMKLYIQRFIHHIGGLPDFSALKFTKYNQYESLIMPMVKYLESHGVHFQYDTKVINVLFDIDGKKKTAKQIICIHEGKEETINSKNLSNLNSKYIYAVTGYENSTANGVAASSTNNKTGIFDLSGCIWERTAAYISNGTTNLNAYGSSYANTTANTNGYLTLSTKYATVYPYNSSSDSDTNNYSAYSEKKLTTYGFGDAVLETSTSGSGTTSWNGDYSNFAHTTRPFFGRGGLCGDSSTAGTFAFSNAISNPHGEGGFRSVLVTK